MRKRKKAVILQAFAPLLNASGHLAETLHALQSACVLGL